MSASTAARLDELRRARPRARFLKASLLLLAALVVYAWSSGDLAPGDAFSARRAQNLERFLSEELVPHPLRGAPFELRALLDWASSVLAGRGATALVATVAIAVLAIVLAGLFSLVLAPLGARTVASPSPFHTAGSLRARPLARFGWTALRWFARAVMMLVRGIPEYVVAFLLLAMLGPASAWPAVLALALHNAGILGRLGSETLENLDPGPLRAVRALGARRGSVLATTAFPLALGRYLLFFFYRFETCVREATVLGMLGIVSLGYWIQDARSKHFYDEMLLFVALGAGVVIAADITSALVRRWLRHAA